MTYVCLIRHGETEWNLQRKIQGTSETVLTRNGYDEALHIALLLKEKQWDRIITSPLKRAFQTAEIIAKELQIQKIEIWEEFQERDYGVATGMYLTQYIEYLNKQVQIEGWESDTRLYKRVLKGLEKIAKSYINERIIVISHGVPIMSIINSILEKPLKEDIFYIKNGSMTSIYYNNHRWNIESVNLINHLDKKVTTKLR